ncbi:MULTISPECIES: DMT family transporter [unclassified Paenibacillus]|uniref:DMT family transporter n=1 Tax=unclassified Paenibacillus TaxID=185978 RepID=UPI002404C61B|nr:MULTISPECIES: DMT family transporter [unclassified Paenibacillus]MDF9842109.1 transporter family-2 protein [Paenibacillus sp. PastF-2]MDF9848637.1 transporter family-2 protein [Paenibacillus sp. PastM-2]MDF9855206.1 transporter family-2 protein [Paenibacillus sp. PastF-1]MDH6480476.1 transporter family-2 protein [Paenibacillus sp. PastH-2]MDH6507904.1 transporter family-2 protein [Paenibacillus sp. PastM-3]
MIILIILFTLLGGITLSAQSSINGTLSRNAGTLETTLLTFVTGTLFLAVVIVFFGQGNLSAIFEAPKWQLSAAFLGTMYLLLTVMAVPRIGVIATNIAGIIGQLVTGIFIDNFGWFNSLVLPLDWRRLAAMLFMLIALYFVYKGNKRSGDEAQMKTV